ncbi:MAG: DUF805 domain-containing protein [Chitinophagaceae bacterium]|nr:MAG: DUF805 domain-containing protein [Chitinophagaceae bacterium]
MKWYLTVITKYAVFTGRARRSEYWYFTLFSIIISILLMVSDEMFGTVFLESIYSLAVLIPSIAVGVRRMHDVGKSGWFLLIPIYNLILACTEGDSFENRYGIDPKGPE